jgi:hypothetical protein
MGILQGFLFGMMAAWTHRQFPGLAALACADLRLWRAALGLLAKRTGPQPECDHGGLAGRPSSLWARQMFQRI